MRVSLFLIMVIGLLSVSAKAQKLFSVAGSSKVDFTSDAPLEMIKASSSQMQGIVNIADRSFAMRVPMNTFKGFNSALQQTHFNDNYMESGKYPHTIFEGKIIEDVDLAKPGTYQVRGKGQFTCHGVVQERIIKCSITVKADGSMQLTSDFSVLLDDHNIKIPSVVNQKIAEEIQVQLKLDLKKR